jgi:hypothetical protein
MPVISSTKAHLEQSFSSKEKRLSALIVLIIELITITPLCGYLFQCGCDWPWLGLDEKCNYHQSHIKQQCPWCVSMVIGTLSTALAIMMGLYASSISMELFPNKHKVKEVLISTLFGLSVFVLTVTVMAIVAASWQN